MIKLIACVIFIILGSIVGIFAGRRYEARVRQLQECDLFLERLQGYLELEKLTTRELFEKLSESESLTELHFLKETAEKMNTITNFPLVWKESLQNSKKTLSLEEDDYQPLYALSDVIGAFDAKTQQTGIETSRFLLKEQLLSAQEKSHQNGRLSRSLGVLSGIAAAVLLL